MKRLLLLSLLATVTFLTAGCGSPEPKSSLKDSEGERVSTIPWNKPQRWESGGALGGMSGN